MGNTQTKNNALQQYQILQQIDPLMKILKHKQEKTRCIFLLLPLYGQQKFKLIERIKTRLGSDKPPLVTPLVSWYRSDQPHLCGNRQSVELIFKHTNPTLQQVFRARHQKNISFNVHEIFYVLRNISLALKSLQKIHQQHGKVNLSNITLHNDVFLMDNLIFERRVDLESKKQEIQGYPSPQKLRSFYDSISNFEGLRSDLFSLGMVGLQLCFPLFDVKSLYLISDPRYSNYRLNLQKLSQMCNQIRQVKLRQALGILLSLNSKDRLNIYAFLKTINIDQRQIRLFEPVTSDQIYAPMQTVTQKPNIQMVNSQNYVFNNSITRQEYPFSTVSSSLEIQKQVSAQVQSAQVPAVNFRPTFIQNQPQIYQNQQFSTLRNQAYNVSNAPSTFQPLRFVMQDNVQTSQFININNSALKSFSSVPLANNKTENPILFPFSQVLNSVEKIKSQTQPQPRINTEVRQLHFTQQNGASIKQQNSSSKYLNELMENLQKDNVSVSTNKKDNIVIQGRSQSIYQEVRPLAMELFKTDRIETTQNKQCSKNSGSKESLEVINGIGISNSYNGVSEKKVQQNLQELSLTPKFSQIQIIQVLQQNINEPVTNNLQHKQKQGPNPQDKIQFVIQQYGIGTRYQGGKLNGMRHGRGKFFYKEGSYYDGDWSNNKMHGIGVLYYPNGTIAYEGEWKDDQFDGKGIVYNDQQVKLQGTFDFTDFNKLDEEWVKYEGDLKNDAKQGFGRLYLTNDQIYQGQFSKDTVHGIGIFRSEKSQKQGIWQNGKLKRLI